MAPSHDTVTPEPAVRSDVWPPVPPPEAMQNTAEMHDTDENPPPGGRVVRAWVHPVGGSAGIGVVVVTPDGALVVVVVDDEVVVVVGRPALRCAEADALSLDVDEPEEHAHPVAARTARDAATTSRLCATCLLVGFDSPDCTGGRSSVTAG